VVEAMRYAALAQGKRLRPFFLAESARLLGAAREHALRAGAALECVHCYSLVHDDLPAMDDDDLRRGRPTCHKAFDEATAILAGDGLLTLAFEIVSDPLTHPEPAVRSQLVLELARAAGHAGMVGGQMLDLEAEAGGCRDIDAIVRLQSMKTGRAVSLCAGGRRHPCPDRRRGARRAQHLCRQGRAGVPDRRRHPRCRIDPRAARQGDPEGQGRRQGDVHRPARPRRGAPQGPAAGR
jgi:hypothetical protein